MHKILGLALASVLGAAGIAFTQPALAQNQITINGGAPCNWSSYSVTSNGNYNFTASGSCGSGTVSPPVCSAPAIAPSNSISEGGTATLTANCTNGPTSFTWTPSSGNSAGGPTITSTSSSTGALTFPTAGTFSYTVTATNGGGTSAASPQATLTVIPLPTVVPVCSAVTKNPSGVFTAGNAMTLTATCSQAPTSYAWTPLDGGPAIASTSNVATVPFPAQGVFNYTVTATNNIGPSVAFPFTVTVGAMVAPTCTVSANPTTIASTGGNTTLTATCTGSPTSYIWSPSSGAPGVTGSGSVVSASFPSGTAAATYTYSVTATNGGGSSTPASANVTVSPPAAAGCVVKDKATLFPSWTQGNAYNTANAPLQNQPPNETWAYKFQVSDLLNPNGNAASAVQIYEGGNPMYTVSISTTPCDMVNSPTSLMCQRSGSSGSLGMSFVASTHSANDSVVVNAGYCRAPAGTELYVNVKFAGPPNVVNPASSTCTLPGGCTYYLLYQKVL